MKKVLLIVLAGLISGLAGYAEVAPRLPVNWKELPQPYQTKSATNPPSVIDRPADAQLSVPEGFIVEEYMDGFVRPRYMINGRSGEILLSDMQAGTVYAIRDRKRHVVIENLQAPYGLALYKLSLYVADTQAIWRYPYDSNKLTVGKAEKIFSLNKFASGHITRTILFNHKEDKLYLSVGSGSNVSRGEPEIRATISRMNPDGSDFELFATGIRNGVGMAWNPVNQTLWVTSHERDGLGDDLVPDYLTEVKQGGFYGWPFAYIGPHEDPRHAGVAPGMVKQTLYPSVLLGSHVGAMDVLFYTGQQFPEKYKNGAFVALHGSWNRSRRVGYEVVFVPFQKGKAIAGPEEFLTGWRLAPDKKEVWGRPVGLLQMSDGSLLVSDDGAGKIWHVSYKKK